MFRHHSGCRAFYLPAVLGMLFSTPTSWANPVGAQVVNGAVSMETIGNTLKITAPDRSVIHWQNFSIGAGETTQFIQPGAMASVLNRVTSGEASHLQGTLQANGRVYLLNPNGIFIGNGAVVDVGSFMATTAHLTDEAFLKGGDFQLSGASEAPIRNAGIITARNGDVFLLAQVVENTGTIRAAQGTVGLMAGREFYVKKEEAGSIKVMVNASQVPGAKKGVGVDQRGTIEALRANLEADGNAYALAINQAGVVRATGVNRLADGTVALSAPGGKILNSGQIVAANPNGSGGEISVSGTEVVFEAASMVTAAGPVDGGEVKIAAQTDNLVSGRLSVDGATGKGGRIELTGNRVGLFDAEVTADGATGGGEVLVGGDYQGLNPLVKNASRTFVSQDSVISADATIAGDGGRVIVWSDNGTQFYGNLSATGGPVSGNGGFAEISGKDWLSFSPAGIDLRASQGSRGTLLLDPKNIQISAAGADAVAGNDEFTENATADADISAANLVAALDNANITLQANNDITFVVDVNASTNADPGNLTLQAGRTISLGAGVDLNIKGSFTATANDSVGVGTAGTEANRDAGAGGFTMAATSSILATGPVSITVLPTATVGAVTFTAGDITLANTVTSTGTQTYSGAVTLAASTTLDSNGGSISFSSTLNGGSQNLTLAAGIGAGTVTVVGNVTALGTGTGAALTVNNAVTGLVDFQGTFAGNSGISAGAATALTFGSSVTLADGDTATTLGTVGFTGTSWSGFDGLSAGAVTLSAGPVSLDSNGGDIQFDSIVGGNQNLTLAAGTGAIRVTGPVGSNADILGDLAISSDGAVTFNGTLDIGGFIQTGTGSTTFNANLQTGAAFNFTGANLTFAAASGNNGIGGDMDVSVSGVLTTGLDANLEVNGAFTQTGAGTVNLGGDVLTDGEINFLSAITLGQPATGGILLQNTAGNIILQASVDGGQILIVDAAGDVTFGGAVGGGTALTSLDVTGTTIAINGGGVSTTGAAGQVYTGAVTLGAGTTLTTVDNDVTFTGPGSTISGAQALVIDAGTGMVTLGGAVGAGALTALTSLEVTGGTIAVNGGEVETTGTQLYTGAVTLGDDTTLTTANSDVTFNTSVSTIQNAVAQTLTIAAGTGTVTFGGAVGGGGTALQSLAVTGVGGNILMDASTVTTTGLQSYTGAVDLGGDTTLTTAGGGIIFGATIGTTTGRALELNSGAGDITVTGAVGSNSDELGDLRVVSANNVTFQDTLDIAAYIQDAGTGTTEFQANLETGAGFSFTGKELTFAAGSGNNVVGGGMTVSNVGVFTLAPGATLASAGVFDQNGAGAVSLGGDVSSADAMTFNSAITLTGTVELQNAAGNLELQNTVAGGFGLTVTSAGTVSFEGALGGVGTELTSLAVTGTTIAINGGSVRTSGDQIYTGPVTLGAATTTMDAGTGQINFSGTLNPDAGFKQLFVTGAGAVNFGGAVGGIIAFSDISVSATTIAIDGALVRNLGTQQYAGAVTLGTDTVLSGSVITFNGTVSGGGNSLTIDGHVPFGMGNAVFNDVVSGLASLSVARNTTINTTGITTTGAQAYNGAVSLGANTTLDAGAGNLVTFSSTVNGARTLAIGGTSNAQFDGVVGGTVALTALTVGGNTAINTTGITTAGIQTYTGAVDLQSSTTLNAGAGNLVTFSSTVNGASDLTIGGTSDVRFDGLVGGGVALTALTIGGNTAINTAAIRTAGNQTYTGAVSAGAVSFTAGTGGIDLRNAGNDFTGNVTIVSAAAITLRDANALSLAGAATSAGQVFVATGNLNTSGAYTISGAGDLLLESANGQVTLGAGTSYAGRNLTVVVGENQSFINQAGAAPFSNSGGRTLVFSSKAKINSPSQLDGGFTGFQPYFNTVPEVVVGPALGTYTVLNSLPGGNLMVYRPPGSSPVHPDHVSQATVNSIVNTEAFQTTVPVTTYSLLTLPRAAVEIRYRMAPNPKASLGPLGFGPRSRGSPVIERPSAEAKRVRSSDFGEISAPAQKWDEAIRTGEVLIHGLKVSLATEPLSYPSF